MTQKKTNTDPSPTFTRQQLMNCLRYAKYRDLIAATLIDGREYTLEAVDRLIEDVMNRKIGG